MTSRSTGNWSGPTRGLAIPAERHPHPRACVDSPAPGDLRIVPIPQDRRPEGRLQTRPRCAGRVRHPDDHAADRRLAGGADPARRPVVRRRTHTGVETTPFRPSHPDEPARPAAAGRGGELRRIRTAVPPLVGRPGDQVAHVHGSHGDDLRRSRHQGRLEHVGVLARRREREAVVA
jgi:hypothetical protein